jgi:hypothetical protein
MCLFAYRDADHSRRFDHLDRILSQVFARPGITRCAVIGRNVDQNHFPYSLTTVAAREDDPSVDELRVF